MIQICVIFRDGMHSRRILVDTKRILVARISIIHPSHLLVFVTRISFTLIWLVRMGLDWIASSDPIAYLHCSVPCVTLADDLGL